MNILIDSDAAMRQFGQDLAAKIVAAKLQYLAIYLSGSLGVGKTTTVRGMLSGLGYDGAVKSPTYTLLEAYELTPYALYHFDLYRLSDPEELEFMGIREYTYGQSISVFEWPEQGRGFIPAADLVVSYRIMPEGAREVTVEALTESGHIVLNS